MKVTTENIYQSILYRAADIWGLSYEDVDSDIGQQFDPLVRFLAGACASELQKVYQHLHETESRLEERLARVLLPEYHHLPKPAHSLATATPVSEEVIIDETSRFLWEGEPETDKDFEVAFSPLVETKLLPAKIKVIATDHGMVDLNGRPSLRKTEKIESTSRILLGIETSSPIRDWSGASVWLGIKGKRKHDSVKTRFYASLSGSTCFLNRRPLPVMRGLNVPDYLLEDYLNGNERIVGEAIAYYHRQFLTIMQHEESLPGEPCALEEFLPDWFVTAGFTEEEINEELESLKPLSGKSLHWLEIRLHHPLEIENLGTRLQLKLNVFPVSNRRLCGGGNGEHHYLQSPTIKWLHLQPKEDFISIRKIYQERPPDYPAFVFKPFAEFREDHTPSYTLRFGGIGRWDDYNVWRRLGYLLSLAQENYEHDELIQEAAKGLSLEELHHLLGKHISKSFQSQKPTRDIYVLLHSGTGSNLRVRVEYWTSLGAKANGISARSGLICKSKQASMLDSESIKLIQMTTGGEDPLSPTEQLDAMKMNLLTRGRIVTKEDVKAFCMAFLKDRVESIDITDGVGTDPRYDFGMTRVLQVKLYPAKKAKADDWEGICQQLHLLLEKKSSVSFPMRVTYSTEINYQLS